MKIGIIGTTAKPISIHATGGTEVFCALLSSNLASLGHEVYLFATQSTNIPGITVISAADKTMSEIDEEKVKNHNTHLESDEKKLLDTALTARTLFKAKEYEKKLDILHDNSSSYLTGSLSDMFDIPIVTTLHMPPTSFGSYLTIPPFVTRPKNHYVAVSKWEQEHAGIPCEVVYNGINPSVFEFDAEGAENLIWIGRIRPDTPKGLKEALIAANKTQKKLKYTGYISDHAYFDTEIKPLLTDLMEDVPLVTSPERKNAFLGSAKAGIFPIMWEEPFGFVFTETMSCGTPIIAFARGAVPEIVKDGVTGFIVNSSDEDIRGDFIVKKTGIDGICEAIDRLYSLSHEEYLQMRRESRKRVEDYFTAEKMAKDYVKIYESVLRSSPSKPL